MLWHCCGGHSTLKPMAGWCQTWQAAPVSSHLACICFLRALVRYVSWLSRATPRPDSRLLPIAVPASVLFTITVVAPASVRSAACLPPRMWHHQFQHHSGSAATACLSRPQQYVATLTLTLCPYRAGSSRYGAPEIESPSPDGHVWKMGPQVPNRADGPSAGRVDHSDRARVLDAGSLHIQQAAWMRRAAEITPAW